MGPRINWCKYCLFNSGLNEITLISFWCFIIVQRYWRILSKSSLSILEKISILLEIKFNSKSRSKYKKIKENIEKQLEEMNNNTEYIEKITKEKRELSKQIRKIDETINDKRLLQ